MSTTFGVAPSAADWYYGAIIDLHGETELVDGYASGDKPTRTALQEHSRCRHSYVAGMMYVHDEDLDTVAATRRVECEKCDHVYGTREGKPLTILEFEVKRTPQSTR